MTYDNIWSKKNPVNHYKSDFPKEFLSLFKKEKVRKVLDLGSGEGTNLIFLAKQGFDVSGIELSEVGVKKTKEKAKKEKVKVNIQKGDIFKRLPFPNQSFDAVIALQSLNHNTIEKIRFAFKDIHRILKKDGIFGIKIADRTTYNMKNMKDNIYLDLDFHEKVKFIDKQTYVPLSGNEKGILHYAFYEKQLIKEVEKAGFTLIKSKKLQWHILASCRKI